MAGHAFDPTLLREYDLRGVVGQTLIDDDAFALGRAFATFLGEERPKVCVGRDGRLSSPSLSARLIEGLVSSGADVIDVGLGPTPMLYYAVHAFAADGGVMVTGSHNEPAYNGFKLTGRGARPIYGDDIKALGRLAGEGRFAEGKGKLRAEDIRDRYVTRLRDGLPRDREKPLNVGWDAGNGAAGDVLRRLVATLPGRHVLLNDAIDGSFPSHHPDPTVPENLDELIRAVERERLDLGIAFDGDGDRIGVVDGRGRIVWGDQLVALLARDVIARRGKDAPIILDVKSSAASMDHIAKALGGRPLLWRTGHSLIKAKMAETGALLAGEMSGHIFIADDYYGYDDALYAAVRLLSLLGGGEALDRMLDRLPKAISTPEVRIDCPEARKFGVVGEVLGRARAAGLEILDIDGIRATTADGWWLLRASNTQPALVARAEASTAEGLARLKASLRRDLEACGVAVPDF